MTAKALNDAIAELPTGKRAAIVKALSDWKRSPTYHSRDEIDRVAKELGDHLPCAGLHLVSLYMVESDDAVSTALFSQNVKQAIEEFLSSAANTTSP